MKNVQFYILKPYPALLCIISIISIISIYLGTGHYNFKIYFLVTIFLFFFISRKIRISINEFFQNSFGLLWVVFIYFYAKFYVTPSPGNELDPVHFFSFAILIPIYYYLILAINPRFKNIAVISLALGMLILGLLNSIYTIYFLEPPYYGKAMHAFSGIIYNSTGSHLLAAFLPLVYFSLIVNKITKTKFTIFLFAFFISLFVALLFTGRTLIFIFLIYIIIYLVFNLNKSNFKKNINYLVLSVILVLILNLVLFLFFDPYRKLFLQLIHRITVSDRLHFNLTYFLKIKNNFFIYPNTEGLKGYYWFHNLIADAHKTSGPYTALVGIFIYTGLLIKVCFDYIKRLGQYKENIYLFVLMLIVSVTAIPLDSSEKQIMLLFSSISALIMSNRSGSRIEIRV